MAQVEIRKQPAAPAAGQLQRAYQVTVHARSAARATLVLVLERGAGGVLGEPVRGAPPSDRGPGLALAAALMHGRADALERLKRGARVEVRPIRTTPLPQAAETA